MDYINLLLVPGLIFLARIIDVTAGTLRIILISKGYKKIAPIVGFFEVIVWLLAISKIIENLSNPVNFIAYAAGFAAGTYVGMLIEERLAMGTSLIQLITREDPSGLVKYLSNEGYTVTSLKSEDEKGPIHIMLSIVKRKRLSRMAYIIKQFTPSAFYTIEDIQYVSELIEPLKPETENKLRSSIKKFKEKYKVRNRRVSYGVRKTSLSLTVNNSLKKILKKK
jgi:uncharacterized protein YebE (UPF0316 family)